MFCLICLVRVIFCDAEPCFVHLACSWFGKCSHNKHSLYSLHLVMLNSYVLKFYTSMTEIFKAVADTIHSVAVF